MNIVVPSKSTYEKAADVLRAGGVIAYPTDTIYGLGVDPFSLPALSKLWQAKGRPENKPVLVIIGEIHHLGRVTSHLTPRARHFIQKFWPGPLSLLLPCHPEVPSMLTAGSQKICVRFPDHKVCQEICREFGGAITSSSANRSGQDPVTSVSEIDFPGVDLAIDGGTISSTLSSTIFDPDEGRVIREGIISSKTLLDEWHRYNESEELF